MAIDVILEFDAAGKSLGQHHVPIPGASRAEWREFLDKKVPMRRRTEDRCYAKRIQTQQEADRETAAYRKLFAAMKVPFPEIPTMYHESVTAFFRHIGYDPETKRITTPVPPLQLVLRQRMEPFAQTERRS